ncbi:MAG: HEAT repeat domain-containing protein [Candidatus Binatia bacterium]
MEEESQKTASLIDSLDHSDKRTIRGAVDSLIAIAARSQELQETLNRLLVDPSRKNRWSIAYILAHLPNPSRSCLKVLLDTLGSEDPDIRWAAGLLLVRLGKCDEGMVTLLLDLLKTGNPIQRRMAAYCLRDMNLKDSASLQAVLASLQDPDPLVRVAAVTSLKPRPEIGKNGLHSLLHLFLADPDHRVRHIAALALAELGAPTDEIRKALKDASRSEDPQLKKAAQAALDLLQKKGAAPPAK